MTFQTWLSRQKERQDNVGRLARKWADIDLNKRIFARRRKKDEHMRWATILTRHGNTTYIQTFNSAWEEFMQAKAQQAE